MSSLYLGRDGARVKSFGSNSRGTHSTVRIELEVSNPSELGYILQQLGELQAEQKPKKAAAGRKPSGPLLLGYDRGGDE